MKFKIRTDKDGKLYWVIYGINGEPICWSESYESEANVNHSIQLVKNGAWAAPIE